MPGTQPIADLADLVAPLSADAFDALLAARETRHFPGTADDAARFSALLDWEGLVDGVRDGRFAPPDLRLMRDRAKVPPMFLRGDAAHRADMIDKLLAADASIILNRAERHVPALGRLCAAIAGQTRDHVSAVAIATAGAGGALDLHYDEYDIVVLQVEGAKTWSIHPDPVINPVYGMAHEPPADPAGRAAQEITLHPGDRLFVPAGWRHRCETQGQRSLHLGVLFYPFTATRAVELILREMLKAPDCRAPLRFGDAAEAATEAAMREQLIDRIAAMPIAELIRLHQSSGAQPGQPDADG